MTKAFKTMKGSFCTISFSFLFCLLIITSSKAEKYALLIGVGDYPESGNWNDLSSKNDLFHLEYALKLNGFKAANITKLEDEKATKKGIVDAFGFLKKKLRQGDIVFIHFSGHGQQVVDQNGDEIDGLDEAIVPFDSPKRYEKGSCEGENLVRDDELNILTKKIRKKAGSSGQVIFTIDACHSGTGTRSQIGGFRGTNIVMAPENLQPISESIAAEHTMQFNSTEKLLAPMACFFASGASESNAETYDDQLQPIGSLSYTVSSILAKESVSLTFSEFYERIHLKMKSLTPNQTPQWEGPKNELVFSGNGKMDSEELFTIKNINKGSLLADVGTLIGIFRGSQVEVFSLDQQKVIGEGIVKEEGLTSSIISLERPLQYKFDELLKIRVTGKVQNLKKVTIGYDQSSGSLQLIDNLKKFQFLVFSNSNPDLFISINQNNELILKTRYNSILFKKDFKEGNIQNLEYRILKQIKRFAQGKFLRGFDVPNPRFNFSIDIFSSDCDTPLTNINYEKKLNTSKVIVGSCIQIGIKNIGSQAAYFSILNIQPDNHLNVLIPLEGSDTKNSDFYLEPGQQYITDYTLTVGEPIGEETLKLICSDEPLDLATIVYQKGTNTRSNEGFKSFEKVLSDSFFNSKSTPNQEDYLSSSIGTKTLFFTVEK